MLFKHVSQRSRLLRDTKWSAYLQGFLFFKTCKFILCTWKSSYFNIQFWIFIVHQSAGAERSYCVSLVGFGSYFSLFLLSLFSLLLRYCCSCWFIFFPLLNCSTFLISGHRITFFPVLLLNPWADVCVNEHGT